MLGETVGEGNAGWARTGTAKTRRQTAKADERMHELLSSVPGACRSGGLRMNLNLDVMNVKGWHCELDNAAGPDFARALVPFACVIRVIRPAPGALRSGLLVSMQRSAIAKGVSYGLSHHFRSGPRVRGRCRTDSCDIHQNRLPQPHATVDFRARCAR